jgi:subtilisin-like proprotein convertase family protein
MPLDLSAGNTIYDTIFIYKSKQIEDLDVNVSINFPQDRDLGIYLIRDGYNIVLLSANNGGDFGNYVNTVFDDEADTLISSGTPPFTGHYKPEKVLSDFHNTTSYGAWILKVVNSSYVFTGEVASWCINIQYHDIIGITNHQVPLKSWLSQNYPNPFNPVTSITYELSSKDCIKLAVYDILGREVEVLQSGEKNPGKYEVTWNASAYSSGIYFYRLTGKNINETKKMLLIK